MLSHSCSKLNIRFYTRLYTSITRQHRNMSIKSLVPANTKPAMSTAVNNFKKYLASESVTVEQLNMSILSDPSGACFVTVMEKFAMHRAYIKGSNGEFLAKNSVISYYRQVKKWLLGFFASQNHSWKTGYSRWRALWRDTA